MVTLNIYHNIIRTNIIGGGVCCYIQSGTPYFAWLELHNPDLETLWLTPRPQHMSRQFSHLTVGIIYHPPGCTARHISDKPWITQACKDLISKRQKAFHKGHDQLYRYYRNQVNRMGKRLQANFHKNKIATLTQ